MKDTSKKTAARSRRPKPNSRATAPVVRLASGPVAPAEAAVTARAAKAAFEAGLKVANLTKIAAVIEGKAMNGDLQAARMLMDYYGMTTSSVDQDDAPRPQQSNAVQINIESELPPRSVRVVSADARREAS